MVGIEGILDRVRACGGFFRHFCFVGVAFGEVPGIGVGDIAVDGGGSRVFQGIPLGEAADVQVPASEIDVQQFIGIADLRAGVVGDLRQQRVLDGGADARLGDVVHAPLDGIAESCGFAVCIDDAVQNKIVLSIASALQRMDVQRRLAAVRRGDGDDFAPGFVRVDNRRAAAVRVDDLGRTPFAAVLRVFHGERIVQAVGHGEQQAAGIEIVDRAVCKGQFFRGGKLSVIV